MLGFAGLVRGHVLIGTLIGGIARFLVHFVVGATIWAEYMPEQFLGIAMDSPWFYSLLYNLVYMIPNILITVVIFLLLAKPLNKYFTAADLAAPAASR